MSTETADEQAFRGWLAERGATVSPGVGLTQFPGMGRGAVALEDIQPDSLLFSLPRTLLLTTSTSRLPSLLPPDSDFPGLSGWTPLILCLMFEFLRPAPSATDNWSAYFALLPAKFNSLMYWSDEELSALEGSLVLTKIGKEEADEEYAEVLRPFVESYPEVFGEAGEYSLELFHRMGSLILSRSFHVESGTEKEEEDEDSDDEEEEREDVADVAMVPMADLLNAKSGADNARLFYEPLHLNMMSTAFIPKGAQIFNTYAEPPNSDLLRRYGHVDDENDADLVEIDLAQVVDLVGAGVSMAEEEREARAEALLEFGLDDTFSFDKTLAIPEELISTIKAFLADDAAWAKCLKKESPPKPKLDAASADWALKVIRAREALYPTSIEEDERLLAKGDAPERERMAVVVRLGEKRILKGAREGLEGQVAAQAAGGAGKREREGEEGKEGKKVKVGN